MVYLNICLGHKSQPQYVYYISLPKLYTHVVDLKIYCGDRNIMKHVCCFFLTVSLAISVRLDLFLLLGNFCDLAWRLLGMRINAFLVVIYIY